ncbi:hypothetical protein GCM10010182_02060 [Actinomadura cremea]|nr:hypothetical protein GCM10010182_02060 [Actinomadura cremea]
MRAGGPLPAREPLDLATSLAEALSAIHAEGLTHRDLKPSNVLLAADGPKVIDFGLAVTSDATLLTGTHPIGTPAYMSPEQCRGGRVEQPSDVFSLGGLLVYAATGHGPFGAGAAHELAYRVVHGEPDLAALDGPAQDRGGTGLPAERLDTPHIEVSLDVDANGHLHVSAEDLATGRTQSIFMKPGSALSEDDIARMAREADAMSSRGGGGRGQA